MPAIPDWTPEQYEAAAKAHKKQLHDREETIKAYAAKMTQRRENAQLEIEDIAKELGINPDKMAFIICDRGGNG